MTGRPDPIEPGKTYVTDPDQFRDDGAGATGGDAAPKPVRAAALGAAIVAVAVLGVGVMLFSFLGPECARDELLKTGVAAKGVIVGIEDTGNRYNDQPQVILKVRVEPEGGDTYETETKMIISPVYLPQFQPGARVNLKYDPADRMKIAVDSVEVRGL